MIVRCIKNQIDMNTDPDFTPGTIYTVTDTNIITMHGDSLYEVINDAGEAVNRPKHWFQSILKKELTGWSRIRIPKDKIPKAVLFLTTSGILIRTTARTISVPTKMQKKAVDLIKGI